VRKPIRLIVRLLTTTNPTRQGDGEPGITTIWRGWSRLADIANMYLIMHTSKDTGNS
jgi:hypothetical protein